MRADEATEKIIASAFQVVNTLGCGFLEKVYERALLLELEERGLRVLRQRVFEVVYKGQSVGEFRADIIVDGQIIVELKCVDKFAPEHLAQCINYLKASNLKIALLLNFQKPRLEWKRIVNGV